MTKMTEAAKRDAIALADKLVPLANDAAVLHADMKDSGEWGTGVTAPMAAALEKMEKELRYLVQLASHE